MSMEILGVARTMAVREYTHGGKSYNIITVVARGTTDFSDVTTDILPGDLKALRVESVMICVHFYLVEAYRRFVRIIIL